MRKAFKEKLKRMMNSGMGQEKNGEFPGDLAEFESFEEFIGEFEGE